MHNNRIGVLISGGGTNLQALIDKAEANYFNASVEIVISNCKDAYGLQRAKTHGIKTEVVDKRQFESEAEFNKAMIEILKNNAVHLVVLAGFLSILSREFVNTFKNQILNIHPALIPSFCGKGFYGKRVHQAALDYGVKITGATVHFVDAGTDTGPIVLQKAIEIDNNDDADSLQKKVLKLEHQLLPLAVKLFFENKLQIIETNRKRTKVKISE